MVTMLLKEAPTGVIEPTDLTRKLTIDGHTKAYPVYKIRLDHLYFNDQNDRIATWISKYKADNNIEEIDISDREYYNDIIQKFIMESNPGAFNKTKTNIELVEQREPGVVLPDGRIVDGNRRFACLRKLVDKNSRFNYFEAVILDRDLENCAKQIKMLELAIQHGEDGKIDYNPIDRLVGVYNDIVDKKILTIPEYAKTINDTEAEVKKQVELAILMVEFLEFMSAPKKFYLAREMELDGPLHEVYGMLKKIKNDEKREDAKIVVFNNLAHKPESDMTRFIRSIKNLVNTDYFDDYMTEQIEIAEKSCEKFAEVEDVSEAFINNKVINDEDTKNSLINSLEKAVTKTKITETRNKPIELIKKCINQVEEIDTNIFKKLNSEQKEIIKNDLILLEEMIANIKESLIGE